MIGGLGGFGQPGKPGDGVLWIPTSVPRTKAMTGPFGVAQWCLSRRSEHGVYLHPERGGQEVALLRRRTTASPATKSTAFEEHGPEGA